MLLIKRRTQIVCVCQQGVEKNIRTYEDVTGGGENCIPGSLTCLVFTKYYGDDKTKTNKIGWTFNMHVGDEKCGIPFGGAKGE